MFNIFRSTCCWNNDHIYRNVMSLHCSMGFPLSPSIPVEDYLLEDVPIKLGNYQTDAYSSETMSSSFCRPLRTSLNKCMDYTYKEIIVLLYQFTWHTRTVWRVANKKKRRPFNSVYLHYPIVKKNKKYLSLLSLTWQYTHADMIKSCKVY